MESKFQRYTKHLLAMGNLSGHVENALKILFPKRMERKDGVLGKLFKEYIFYAV